MQKNKQTRVLWLDDHDRDKLFDLAMVMSMMMEQSGIAAAIIVDDDLAFVGVDEVSPEAEIVKSQPVQIIHAATEAEGERVVASGVSLAIVDGMFGDKTADANSRASQFIQRFLGAIRYLRFSNLRPDFIAAEYRGDGAFNKCDVLGLIDALKKRLEYSCCN